MSKVNNIKYTFQVIRDFPLSIPYTQVEKWVMDYEEKGEENKKIKSISRWLSIKYRFFKRWKK